jgi:hypothetical protein
MRKLHGAKAQNKNRVTDRSDTLLNSLAEWTSAGERYNSFHENPLHLV